MKRKKTDLIVVHCSASAFGNAELIDKWHREPPRNWKKIGYHFVILNGRLAARSKYNPVYDGLVEVGRDVGEVGCHEKTANSRSIGICLIGDRWFTWRQFESLATLLRQLKKQYPGVKIVGHCDTKGGKAQGKYCPSFSAAAFACRMA